MRLPDFVTPIVGNNLFRLRRAARLTRPALAARIKLLPHRCVSPLSVASLTQLERGQRQSITSDEVAVLATVLHVPASTLTKASTVVAPFAPPPTRGREASTRRTLTRRTAKLQTIRRQEVGRALGVSNATIGRWIRAGNFPQGIRIGPNAVVFDLDAIRGWLGTRRVPRKEAATPTT